MGREVEKKINFNHPKMIDYATSNFQSDFLDAFLSHECHFYISTGFGAEAFALIFRKPIIYCSFAHFDFVNTFSNKSITIFKNYIFKKKKLSLREIYNKNLIAVDSNKLKKANIKLKENTPKEILETIKEMLLSLKKKNKKKTTFKLNTKFWNIFKILIKKNNLEYLHGKIYGKIGTYFLKKNRYLLR